MNIQEGVEGQRPRRFGEDLATSGAARVGSLILNSLSSKNLQGGGVVFFDVSCVFLAACRYHFAGICSGFYGNACRRLLAH